MVSGCSPTRQSVKTDSVEGRGHRQLKGEDRPDVLEKAYHVATALSAVPTAHAGAYPPADRDAAKNEDAPTESSPLRLESHLHERCAAIRATQECGLESDTSLGETVNTTGLSKQIAPRAQLNRLAEPITEGNAGALSDEGTRAVEAEGLIWVDELQATAYSVRYAPNVFERAAIYALCRVSVSFDAYPRWWQVVCRGGL